MLSTLAVNWSHFGTVFLIMLFLAVCALLMLTVLIQKPQGGGLAGAFGSGAGSGQTAFGAQTGDALTVATIFMFVLWIGASVAMNYVLTPGSPKVTTPTIESPVSGGSAPATQNPDMPANAGTSTPTPPATGNPAPAQPQPEAPAQPTTDPAPSTPEDEAPAPSDEPANTPQNPPADPAEPKP